MHPPLDLGGLVAASVIETPLSHGSHEAWPVRMHLGHVAHVARVARVLFLPDLGLPVIGDRIVPIEGIGEAWNLGHLQRGLSRRAQDGGGPLPYATAFETRCVDEEVCIVSNMFSWNFCHFTEELFKILILERSGLRPRYAHVSLPAFAREYLRALGIDRDRLLPVGPEPVIFRSALYTTPLTLSDLSRCPDVLFELRDRLFAAVADLEPLYGPRVWLDRGQHVVHEARELVNSDEIDECLEAHGVRRLDIGSLPLFEQIAVARDAEVMAGPHGAALTHCMYMKPRSTLIEAFSPLYLNHCWTEVCRVLNHRYAMLAGSNAPHSPYKYGTRVHVAIDQLRLALQSVG